MQSSLFLKIFLWFWLAMTVVGGALVISGETTRYRRPIPGPRIGWAAQPAALALRLLVVVMTGGVVCYGLARYLTSPVAKLQKATQQLAKGDLTTRVGSVLEKRGDEFADLGHDFDLMAERIEWLINSQRRLLSDISHELRSPLARLNVALELARKRTGSEAGASLDRIGREAERMNELISE
ncbi:MAG: HAMP domain-containing protein, partial [Spirochaetia bacterium]